MSTAPPEAVPTALEAVGASLRTLVASSRRLRGRETHQHERLSFAQYSLLFSLAEAQELPASELARNAALTPATVAQMLESLETAGLVTRRRAEADRRVVLTTLTEHGERVVAERRARIEPRWTAALEDFDDDELQAAAAVMGRIAEFFDDLHERP